MDRLVDDCSVSGEPVLIVDGSGFGNYTTIQAAIDNASSGATIRVWSGRYDGNIEITKSISLIGNGTSKTIINGSSTSIVVTITAPWVNVSGFLITGGKITGERIGINLNYVHNCTLFALESSGHTIGLHVNNSISTKLINNTFSSNYYDGINLENSRESIISRNKCSGNFDNLYLFRSSGNTIKDNNCSSSFRGIHIHQSSNNILKNNTCNFNQWGGIAFYSASNNIITNNSCLDNSGDGILLSDSDNIILDKNTINKHMFGISLQSGSDNCRMFNTSIANSYLFDLRFFGNSHATALNCSLNWSNIYYGDKTSTLKVQWFMHIIVVNGKGLSVPGAAVQVKDYNSAPCFSSLTGTSGKFSWILCTQYIETQSGKTSIFTPHNISVTKRAFEAAFATPEPNMTMSKVVKILLPNDVTPPAPPANLKFTSLGAHHLNFSWTQPVKDDVYGYNVYINETGTNSVFRLLGTTESKYYNATNLEDSTTYYFAIKSYDDVPWYSVPLVGFNTTLDITAPSAPTGLEAKEPTGHTITLVWAPNSEPDVMGYNVYINASGGGFDGSFHRIHKILGSTTQYIVTELLEETQYYFVVDAFDEVPNVSPLSNVASATTLDVSAPGSPTGLSARALSGTKIQLSWDPNPEADIAGYQIYITTSNSGATGTFNFHHEQMGTNTSCVITGLFEDTKYYFKIKAFDEVPNVSNFSNVASVSTPDTTPPSAPTGLTVSDPTNNSLTLSWSSNPEPDVIGYIIYRSLSKTGSFEPLNSEPINKIQFKNNGLQEVTRYYYKLKAVDDALLSSAFSPVAYGTTLLGPHGPEIKAPVADFAIPEDSYNNSAINLYDWFTDLNSDPLEFGFEGAERIEVTIFQNNGTVVLKPEKDWNGVEKLVFSAADDTGEISDDVVITVTPVNDPPGQAIIIDPENNFKIDNGTPLALLGQCSDPDIPYGDELTFTWSSNLTGELGFGEMLSEINLSVGSHLITLEVSDLAGEHATVTINLYVSEIIDPNPSPVDPGDNPPKKETKPGLFNTTCMVFLFLIIIIIVLIAFIVVRRDALFRPSGKTKSKVISAWPEVRRKKGKLLPFSDPEVELRCPKCDALVKPSASRCPKCLKHFGEF